MVVGEGGPGRRLDLSKVREILDRGTPPGLFRGKRVLVLTPDATRTCPHPIRHPKGRARKRPEALMWGRRRIP